MRKFLKAMLVDDLYHNSLSSALNTAQGNHPLAADKITYALDGDSNSPSQTSDLNQAFGKIAYSKMHSCFTGSVKSAGDADGPDILNEKIPLEPELSLEEIGCYNDPLIKYEMIQRPHKKGIYDEMCDRINNFRNTDTVVYVGDAEYHVHLIVLQCYSKYFDDGIHRKYNLPEERVSQDAFETMYYWMLRDGPENCLLLTRRNVLELFVAAQFLQVREMEEQCWTFMDSTEVFYEDTAFMLFLQAIRKDVVPVMQMMLERIMKFFMILVASEDFLYLRVEEVCTLLKSSYITINSELDVFMSAVRWLMHDWDDRRQCLIQVMSCVRFGLINSKSLIGLTRGRTSPEILEVMSHPDVLKMRDEGLSHSVLFYGENREDYNEWMQTLEVKVLDPRHYTEKEKLYRSYAEFLAELDDVKMAFLKASSRSHVQQNTMTPSKTFESQAEIFE